ncbi:hypothetical protein EERA1257_02800 [Escherichia coli]|uniref:DUF805 domain-containing protein n=2 Tax=Escherichia coli TaxID=562 RepID=UPI003254865D
MDWYLKVLKNYVGFRGRARRKEYWMFILVNIIFTFVLGLLDKMLGWQRAGGEGILTTIYGILVFLPWWAVQFRRLHDTDRSAWWALLFLGNDSNLLIVFYVQIMPDDFVMQLHRF